MPPPPELKEVSSLCIDTSRVSMMSEVMSLASSSDSQMQILGKFFSTATAPLALPGTPSTNDLFLDVGNSGGGGNASSSSDKRLLLLTIFFDPPTTKPPCGSPDLQEMLQIRGGGASAAAMAAL
ncbi:hypothetical protein COCNU_07G012130 [Cocos nucifera]|uniref:Uncharacterized protein n=1 Tax=Cocos nucifera TaxID=13894 RepID=A0A8K0N5E4_COCNU|nr:hypothetical protein COCNU_07G012130 [Cocos nucifera]